MRQHRCIRFWFSILYVLLALPVQAELTNLAIGNFDFEDTSVNGVSTPGIVDDLDFEAEYSQWSTGANSFEIVAQGSNGAPTTFQDGSSTGQSLEIRGQRNGQITLVVDIPNDPNILPGADAELRFEAWSEGGSAYEDTGTVRIRVNGTPVTGFNPASVNSASADSASNVWTLNTYAFNVSAGDTVDFQWRDSGASSTALGIRIDNVQLLVDIIPEPAQFGTLFVGSLMLILSLRRRHPDYQLSGI